LGLPKEALYISRLALYIYHIGIAKMPRQHCMLALFLIKVAALYLVNVKQYFLMKNTFNPISLLFLVKLIEFCVENVSFCSLSIILRLIYVL
jgi:hypothetical protein